MGKISKIEVGAEDVANINMVDFIEAHKETFVKFVKYEKVIDALIKSVSKNEVKAFNEAYPCKCRAECDEPFKCSCIIATNGEAIKTMNQCKECAVRGKL